MALSGGHGAGLRWGDDITDRQTFQSACGTIFQCTDHEHVAELDLSVRGQQGTERRNVVSPIRFIGITIRSWGVTMRALAVADSSRER